MGSYLQTATHYSASKCRPSADYSLGCSLIDRFVTCKSAPISSLHDHARLSNCLEWVYSIEVVTQHCSSLPSPHILASTPYCFVYSPNWRCTHYPKSLSPPHHFTYSVRSLPFSATPPSPKAQVRSPAFHDAQDIVHEAAALRPLEVHAPTRILQDIVDGRRGRYFARVFR